MTDRQWRVFWQRVFRASAIITIVYYVYLLREPLTIAVAVGFCLLVLLGFVAKTFEIRMASMDIRRLDELLIAQDWSLMLPVFYAATPIIQLSFYAPSRDFTLIILFFTALVGVDIYNFSQWRLRRYWERQIEVGMLLHHLQQTGIDLTQLRKDYLITSGLAERLRSSKYLKNVAPDDAKLVE